MFPLRDNIPTERLPIVTIILIVANVLAYFFFQHGTITLGDPSNEAYLRNLVENATIPYELGFEHIAAGPLVRSSYHADEHVKQDLAGTGPLAAA